jgi:hypothetical protein
MLITFGIEAMNTPCFFVTCVTETGKNGKAIPVMGHGGPQGCDIKAPTFSRQLFTDGSEVALHAGRSLLAGTFPVLISVRG